VGTVEILTDMETKKDMWQEPLKEYWSGPEDPDYCVLRFSTERYNLYIVDGEMEAKGTLKDVEKKTASLIEPMLQFDRQCEQAIELYKEAFGAKVITFIRYADANPQDWSSNNEDGKDLIYHAQMMIGSQRILLCDNLFNDLPRGHSVYPVITFKTADEVKAAYNVLADGATTISPIGNTTYSACVVSFVDKFGIHWDFMAE
jgi:PhnB protein